MIVFFLWLQANRDDDSNSDSDSLDDDAEETALESYQTPLDDENSPIDEYIIFKHIFSSKCDNLKYGQEGLCSLFWYKFGE